MNTMTKRCGNRGFTYLGLLLMIVVMGVVLGAAAEVWHTAVQREKERELLFVGNQFRTAIGLYYIDHSKYPHNLEDLVKDSQYAFTKRYLRKIYRDPMTGSGEWGVVRRADGGIVGMHSLSENRPIKIAGFGVAGDSFVDAVKYSDWVFAHRLRQNVPMQNRGLDSNRDKPLL